MSWRFESWRLLRVMHGQYPILPRYLETLVLKTGALDRYKELVLQSYVTANANLRFCPHPSCTETVFCTGGRGQSLLYEVPTVRCSQGHPFCFGCGFDEDHRPVICAFVPKWMKSAREDAGTSQWIRANTRMCPKCQNNIEKNGGCKCVRSRYVTYKRGY